MTDTLLVHATAIAIDGRAVLLRGASGSGKSDLALRLIDAGARLVADDQSELWRRGEAIIVRAPATIAGLLEVRGIGIVRLDALPEAPLALIADLVEPEAWSGCRSGKRSRSSGSPCRSSRWRRSRRRRRRNCALRCVRLPLRDFRL